MRSLSTLLLVGVTLVARVSGFAPVLHPSRTVVNSVTPNASSRQALLVKMAEESSSESTSEVSETKSPKVSADGTYYDDEVRSEYCY